MTNGTNSPSLQPQPLQPDPNRSPEATDKSGEAGNKESENLFKEGRQNLEQARKNGDLGAALMGIALLLGAIFALRRQRRETTNSTQQMLAETGGFDPRIVDDPEATLKEIDTQHKTGAGRGKDLQDTIVKFETDLKAQSNAGSPVALQLRRDIENAQQEAGKISGEGAQLGARIARLKIEQGRRQTMVQAANKSLTGTSPARNLTLQGNRLTIDFLSPITGDQNERLEKIRKQFGGYGVTISTSQDDLQTVTLTVPAEFWSEWTPGQAGTGRGARLAIFAFLSGRGTETQTKQGEAKTKQGEAGAKEDRAKTNENDAKTKELQAKERGNAIRENAEREARVELFSTFLVNRMERLENRATGKIFFRATEVVSGGRQFLHIRILAAPTPALQWATSIESAGNWRSVTDATGLPSPFTPLIARLGGLLGQGNEGIQKTLEVERIHAERKERGRDYLVSTRGAVMLRNSRNEEIFQVSRTDLHHVANIYFRYDMQPGQWRWSRNIDESPGKALSDQSFTETFHHATVDLIAVTRELQAYNGDVQAVRKTAEQNFILAQRSQLGEVQLRAVGAKPLPNRPDVYEFRVGTKTVYFRYLAGGMGWVWSEDKNAHVPPPEGIAGQNQNRFWMPLRRTYVPRAGQALGTNEQECNRVAGLLLRINEGDAVILRNPEMQAMQDRDNRIRGIDLYLRNAGAGLIDGEPNMFALSRGVPPNVITIYVFLSNPNESGERTWQWTRERGIATTRQTGMPMATPLTIDGATPGQATIMGELNQILTQIRGVQEGSVTFAQKFHRRQDQLQRGEVARETAHRQYLQTFLWILFRRGARFEVPVHDRAAGEQANAIADTRYTAMTTRATGIPPLHTSAMGVHLVIDALSIQRERVGFYVDEVSGTIRECGSNIQLWPAPPRTDHWNDMLRSDPSAALRELLSIPANRIRNTACVETLTLLRTSSIGASPVAPHTAGPVPPELHRGRPREAALKALLASHYTATARSLQDRYRAQLSQLESLEKERSAIGRNPFATNVSVVSRELSHRQNLMKIARDYEERCIRNYWKLVNNFPSQATAEDQLQFLQSLLAETDDIATLERMRKDYQALDQRIAYIQQGLKKTREVVATGASMIPWGAEVFYGTDTVVSILSGADINETLQNNAIDYAMAKTTRGLTKYVSGPLLQRIGIGNVPGIKSALQGIARHLIPATINELSDRLKTQLHWIAQMFRDGVPGEEIWRRVAAQEPDYASAFINIAVRALASGGGELVEKRLGTLLSRVTSVNVGQVGQILSKSLPQRANKLTEQALDKGTKELIEMITKEESTAAP